MKDNFESVYKDKVVDAPKGVVITSADFLKAKIEAIVDGALGIARSVIDLQQGGWPHPIVAGRSAKPPTLLCVAPHNHREL
jgi:hypothetical protein